MPVAPRQFAGGWQPSNIEAEMIARTGQITGSGIANLGAGLAAGLSAGFARRDRRKELAEQRAREDQRLALEMRLRSEDRQRDTDKGNLAILLTMKEKNAEQAAAAQEAVGLSARVGGAPDPSVLGQLKALLDKSQGIDLSIQTVAKRLGYTIPDAAIGEAPEAPAAGPVGSAPQMPEAAPPPQDEGDEELSAALQLARAKAALENANDVEQQALRAKHPNQVVLNQANDAQLRAQVEIARATVRLGGVKKKEEDEKAAETQAMEQAKAQAELTRKWNDDVAARDSVRAHIEEIAKGLPLEARERALKESTAAKGNLEALKAIESDLLTTRRGEGKEVGIQRRHEENIALRKQTMDAAKERGRTQMLAEAAKLDARALDAKGDALKASARVYEETWSQDDPKYAEIQGQIAAVEEARAKKLSGAATVLRGGEAATDDLTPEEKATLEYEAWEEANQGASDSDKDAKMMEFMAKHGVK